MVNQNSQTVKQKWSIFLSIFMYLKQYLILLSLAKKAVQNESIAWGTFFQIFFFE